MHIPFGIPIPFLEMCPRCGCISASSRKFIAAFLELVGKLEIAMYTRGLAKQTNSNKHKECLLVLCQYCSKSSMCLKPCSLTRTLTPGSLLVMVQPYKCHSNIPKHRGRSRWADTKTTREKERIRGNFRTGYKSTTSFMVKKIIKCIYVYVHICAENI